MNNALFSIIFIGTFTLFSSCASNYIAFHANQNVKHVALGQTKQHVMETMGNLYILDSSKKDADGNLIESIVYKSDANEEYKFLFRNNILEEWTRYHINCISSLQMDNENLKK